MRLPTVLRRRRNHTAGPPGRGAAAAATAAEPTAAPHLPGGAADEVRTLEVRTDAPEACRVVVVGSSGGLRTLPQHLPASWSLAWVDEVGDLTVADLVVLTQPTDGKIGSVRARQPDASVIVLAHPAAGVDAVVGLLAAGATACVRSADPALVAAHLVACARRYPVATAWSPSGMGGFVTSGNERSDGLVA